jgi:hypothetical protein
MGTSKPRSRKKTAGAGTSVPVTTAERHRMITEAAYYLAERRGFTGGSAEDDWLRAEREVDRALQRAPRTAADASSGEARSSGQAQRTPPSHIANR